MLLLTKWLGLHKVTFC